MPDYKKEYFKELKKSKYAWGQYYQLRNELFNLQHGVYDEVNEVIEEGDETFNENHNETSAHLMRFIRELYKKAKESCECPICLEEIEIDDLETTGCGHNFHSQCLDVMKTNAEKEEKKFIECAICRSRIYCRRK